VAASRRRAAVMFTDLVGYTSIALANEVAALRLLEEQEEFVRSSVPDGLGRVVKSTGDGLLLEFGVARDAARCAFEVQRRLRERNSRTAGPALRVRIGIHVGEVEERSSDIVGGAVNLAARIESVAEPGGIFLSRDVFDRIHDTVPFELEPVGFRSLKGIPEPVEIFRVVLPREVEAHADEETVPIRLAVLPLTNISPDPSDEYLALGLTEELTSALSRIQQLRVIARTSVMQYRNAPRSVAEIGRELGLTTLLEGSVRKLGSRIRVTLQLIDVPSEEHVWTETFDRDVQDLFEVQREIAEKTASVLRLDLGIRTHGVSPPRRPSVEAYSLFMRAIHEWADDDSNADEMQRLLEEAIAKDPGFAAPRAYLVMNEILDHRSPRTNADRIRDLADGALRLDSESPDAQVASGLASMYLDRNWATAETRFHQAISINPSSPLARLFLGQVCTVLQRNPEAQAELAAAANLDPFWTPPRYWMAYTRYVSGDLSGAIQWLERFVDRQPTIRPLLGRYYVVAGRWDDARRQAESTPPGHDSAHDFSRVVLLTQLGDRPAAERWIASAESSTEAYLWRACAALQSLLGCKDRALDILEHDAREGECRLWETYFQPYFDPIRDDPRFVALLESLGLPTTTPWSRSS